METITNTEKISLKRIFGMSLLAVCFFLVALFISDITTKYSFTPNIEPATEPAPIQTTTPQQEEKVKVENEPITPELETEEGFQITEEEKILDYEIVYEVANKRYDGGKNFYVLIDKIDLSTADFKSDIKKMVDEIVKSKGGKISIDFVNHKETLDLIYKSHYGNNILGRILTKAEMDKIGESLVAHFTGQMEIMIYLNTLSFFPGTFTDNPKVGKYVETIEYNPNK